MAMWSRRLIIRGASRFSRRCCSDVAAQCQDIQRGLLAAAQEADWDRTQQLLTRSSQFECTLSLDVWGDMLAFYQDQAPRVEMLWLELLRTTDEVDDRILRIILKCYAPPFSRERAMQLYETLRSHWPKTPPTATMFTTLLITVLQPTNNDTTTTETGGGDLGAARYLWSEMMSLDVTPTREAFGAMIAAGEWTEEDHERWGDHLLEGAGGNRVLLETLLGYQVDKGDVSAVEGLVTELRTLPGSDGCLSHLAWYHVVRGAVGNRADLIAHEEALRNELVPDIAILCALIRGYMTPEQPDEGNPEDVDDTKRDDNDVDPATTKHTDVERVTFEALSHPSVTWSPDHCRTLLEGSLHINRMESVASLLETLRSREVWCEPPVYSAALSLCEAHKDWDEVKRIFADVRKAGWQAVPFYDTEEEKWMLKFDSKAPPKPGPFAYGIPEKKVVYTERPVRH